MFNLGGLGGLGGLSNLMGVLPKLPGKMQELQERLKQDRIESEAGDGAVRVVVSGTGQVISVMIDRTARENAHLEAWVAEAMNKAGAEAKRRTAEAVSQMARDLNINAPGLDSMLANLTGGM